MFNDRRLLHVKNFISAILTTAIAASASGATLVESKPVSDSATAADAILLVTVLEYKALDARATMAVPLGQVGTSDPMEIIKEEEAWPRGNYHFRIEATLKGELKDELMVELPSVNEHYLNHVELPEKPKGLFLLLLKRNGATWMTVDPTLPLVPVSENSLLCEKKASKGYDYVNALLDTLGDMDLRSIPLFLLHDIVDKRIAVEAFKWSDDKDNSVRDHALLCMATNQDVRAIPLIVSWDDEVEKEGHSMNSIGGLKRYRVPEAVALLNPVIVDHSTYARRNAILALQHIADKSSIPFLIQALEKDDDQHLISYGAYTTLYHLADISKQPPRLMEDFLNHRDEEIQKLKQWWEWEQVKEKKVTSKPATQPVTQPATTL